VKAPGTPPNAEGVRTRIPILDVGNEDGTSAFERPLPVDDVDVLGDLIEQLMDVPKTVSAHGGTLADRDRLLAIFTHDLRNLLGVLSLNTELFLQKQGETAQANASNMRRAIERMDRLISSLFDLAKLNAGKLDVTLEPQDAAEVVREAVEIFRPVALAKSVTLTLTGADRPLRAKIDHDRMFQVLSNLLSNAVKFTPGGGEIRVTASTFDGRLEIRVDDSGIGIPEGDLERVFECYRQLDDAGRDGLGLGLFISKAIVQAHGGRIWATSRGASGSTFFLTVPALESEARLILPSALGRERMSL